jgi:hypothetical protein
LVTSLRSCLYKDPEENCRELGRLLTLCGNSIVGYPVDLMFIEGGGAIYSLGGGMIGDYNSKAEVINRII